MAPKPIFDVPSGATAKVSIIDSTLKLSKLKVDFLIGPPVEGFDEMNGIPTWSFLVESSTGQKVLYDLGVPKDQSTFTPTIQKYIKDNGWDLQVEKDVADILKENGIEPKEIQSIIWSHHHFDHIGDISTFPDSTEMVVGPGFKEVFGRGYPTVPDSPVHESYWSGRKLREISFDDAAATSETGPFRAHDFFGDGSFYLVDSPGHAVGHLAGLARTSQNPDTFIFIGGDLCHHGGEMRPTEYNPIPETVQILLPDKLRARMSTCPGDIYRKLNVKRGRKEDEPIFDSLRAYNLAQAVETIKKSQTADAQENVFFIFAHDESIRGVVDLFPAAVNDWKSKGWREATHWAFLKDLSIAANSQ